MPMRGCFVNLVLFQAFPAQHIKFYVRSSTFLKVALCHLHQYRTAQNFGGGKFWRIWRIL